MIHAPRIIFYTDDDEDDRLVFSDALQEVAGDFEVATQRNGDELMQMLKNPPPHPSLVFLDLNMPLRNGYTLLKEIREKEGMTALPVVIFSTSNDEESISTSRQLGASLYVPKPASFAALKEALRYVLSINWKNFSPSPEDFVFNAC